MNPDDDKPTLILHIGLGKTGSTVLQRFFQANRQALATHGIIYPSYGEIAGAHHLLSPHLPENLRSQWEVIPASTWVPALAEAHSGISLLSSELIASCDEDTVRELCAVIQSRFALKIVVYVRRQDDSVMANYNQQVKTGKQLHKIADVFDDMLPKVDFTSVLRRWAEPVGRQNIIVRPYERRQFHRQDIRLDFLYHVFGLDAPDDFTIEQSDPNPRLDRKILEYKRLLNNVITDREDALRLQRLLVQHEQAIKSELGIQSDIRDLLSPAARRRIIDNCEQKNREVAMTYLGRTDGKLFLEPPPEPDTPWSEVNLSKDEVLALSRYLATKSPGLMRSVERSTVELEDSERPVQSRSARFLAAALDLDARPKDGKMKTLIIHAGTHKTGSTAIQAFLAARAGEPGYDLIHDKEANASLLMMQAFRENLSQLPHFEHETMSEEQVSHMRYAARKRLEALCRQVTQPLSILSAEEISTFTIPELEDIYAFMAPLFDEIKIILYVRPLKARMESTYQEVLKTRYRSLEQRFPLNYMGLARNFDSVFGRENVQFYNFSRDTFPEGSIVAHFAQAAGIPGEFVESRSTNTRLSREAVQLLYAYRLYFRHTQRGDRAILDKLETLQGEPFHFHSSLYHKLLHTGKNASVRFAERSGFSIEEDIEENDDIGIRDESDLLAFPKASINWLNRQLTLAAKLRFRKSSRPEKVARAINSLRSTA